MTDRPAHSPLSVPRPLPAEPPRRWRSLDIFRGAAVALMILVNNPGSWSHLYPPLAHAAWHGLTPTDLVFPFFLFAVGNAMALGPAPSASRVLRRTALIFALGLFLNATPFVQWNAAGELSAKPWETLRLMGVLQRIALAYGVAALLLRLAGPRGAAWAALALLLGYGALCVGLGAPGDAWSLQGWFGTGVDRALLGASHLYRGEGVPFDPEGLASTPPAVAQVLLGWWVGRHVAQGAAAPRRLALELAFFGAGLLGWAAMCEQLGVPVNKKLWTPSYVLVTTGWAMALLAALVWAVEGGEGRARAMWTAGWARFLEAFGRNALFVFVLSGFVPRVLALLRWPDGLRPDGGPRCVSPLPWVYEHVFAGVGGDPRFGSLLYAVAHLAVYAALVWWLDRRRIYLRA
jgi:predicted acyltransferase